MASERSSTTHAAPMSSESERSVAGPSVPGAPMAAQPFPSATAIPNASPARPLGATITLRVSHWPSLSEQCTAAPHDTVDPTARATGAPISSSQPASATLVPNQPTAPAGARKDDSIFHPSALRCTRWTMPGRGYVSPAPGSPMAIQSALTATAAPNRALARGDGGRRRVTNVTPCAGAGPTSKMSTAPLSRSGESARGDPTTIVRPSVATAAPNSDAGTASGQVTSSTDHDPS